MAEREYDLMMEDSRLGDSVRVCTTPGTMEEE